MEEMFEGKSFTKIQEKVGMDLELDEDLMEALLKQAQELNCDVEDIVASVLRDVCAETMTMHQFKEALLSSNIPDHANIVDAEGTVIYHFDRVYGFDKMEGEENESVRS